MTNGRVVRLPRADGQLGPEVVIDAPHNMALAWSNFLRCTLGVPEGACHYCFAPITADTLEYRHTNGPIFCEGPLRTIAMPGMEN